MKIVKFERETSKNEAIKIIEECGSYVIIGCRRDVEDYTAFYENLTAEQMAFISIFLERLAYDVKFPTDLD